MLQSSSAEPVRLDSDNPGSYLRAASAVKARSLLLFRFGQFAMFCVRALWRHRRPVAGFVLVAIVLPGALAIWAAPPPYQWILLGISGLAALALFAGLVLSFVQMLLIRLAERVREQTLATMRHEVDVAITDLRRLMKREVEKVRQESRERLDGAITDSRSHLEDFAREQAGISFSKAQLNLTTEMKAMRAEIRVDQDSMSKAISQSLDDFRKRIATVRKSMGADRLRERMAAGERQIGALRYPDAPRCVVFFGHHKCASRLFRREVFQAAADSTGARVRQYHIANPPFHYSRMDELDLCNIDFSDIGKDKREIVLFSNSTQRSLDRIRESTDDWRGIRIIRDPRQVLISNYLHHAGDHADDASKTLGWIWDQLVHDKPILRELPKEDGILYELDNISKGIIEEQLLCPFEDERVMTIKIEDFASDSEGYLRKISEFLEIPDIAGVDLSRTFANPDSGPWQNHFTSRLREVFKERYGKALVELGYEKDLNW